MGTDAMTKKRPRTKVVRVFARGRIQEWNVPEDFQVSGAMTVQFPPKLSIQMDPAAPPGPADVPDLVRVYHVRIVADVAGQVVHEFED